MRRHPLPRRILVLCLPGIGDAILFTPALALLRRAFPEAHITALTMFRGAADVLETNPDVDEVRWFDFFNAGVQAGVRYVWRLRRERFDLSILGFPANRVEYNLVNAFVGRRWRAGHGYQHQRGRNLGFLNNIRVREHGDRHNVEENLALVRAICRRIGVSAPVVDTRLTVRLTADDVRQADRLLAERGIAPDDLLIGFHTYSSTFKNMHRKCWDQANFARLIRRLGEQHPTARPLLFCGPSDIAVTDYLVREAGGRALVIAEPHLRRALGVLQRCRVFVSNDSAIMHLAGTLGVPVVALFGPTDARRLHPWAAPHTIVRKDLACMPCFYYSSRPLRCAARADYACMREITVDEVLGAIETVLARSDRGRLVASR
jgi:lipopolysaccharide heptosyltransferase II